MSTLVERFRDAERLLNEKDALGSLRLLEPFMEEHGDDPAVLLLAGRAYYHSAQLGRARETLTTLIERDPSDHYARFLLGRTLERAGRPEEALPHLRMAAVMFYEPDYQESVNRVERRLGKDKKPAAKAESAEKSENKDK